MNQVHPDRNGRHVPEAVGVDAVERPVVGPEGFDGRSQEPSAQVLMQGCKHLVSGTHADDGAYEWIRCALKGVLQP